MSMSGKMLTKGTNKMKIKISRKLKSENLKSWLRESQSERRRKPKTKWTFQSGIKP
jgi:hypothetical protein